MQGKHRSAMYALARSFKVAAGSAPEPPASASAAAAPPRAPADAADAPLSKTERRKRAKPATPAAVPAEQPLPSPSPAASAPRSARATGGGSVTPGSGYASASSRFSSLSLSSPDWATPKTGAEPSPASGGGGSRKKRKSPLIEAGASGGKRVRWALGDNQLFTPTGLPHTDKGRAALRGGGTPKPVLRHDSPAQARVSRPSPFFGRGGGGAGAAAAKAAFASAAAQAKMVTPSPPTSGFAKRAKGGRFAASPRAGVAPGLWGVLGGWGGAAGPASPRSKAVDFF